VRDLFVDREAFDAWARATAARLRAEGSDDASARLAMNRVEPQVRAAQPPGAGGDRKARAGDFARCSGC
jgi:hypothetical protein